MYPPIDRVFETELEASDYALRLQAKGGEITASYALPRQDGYVICVRCRGRHYNVIFQPKPPKKEPLCLNLP